MEIDIHGKRIVNIANLFPETKNIDSYRLFNCRFKDMILIGERKLGMKSIFSFKCCMCNIKK